MIPHRDLYQIITKQNVCTTAQRSSVYGGSNVLEALRPYVVTSKVVETLLESGEQFDYVKLDPRPFDENKSKNVLIFFPGGVGDVLCFKAALESFVFKHWKKRVHVVSSIGDNCIFGDLAYSWNYPLEAEIVDRYDAWINIAELDIASLQRELSDTFAEYLGVEPPRAAASLHVDENIVFGLRGVISDTGRIKVGFHVTSAAVHRTLNNTFAMKVAANLIRNGCDIYWFSNIGKRIIFLKDGVLSPPIPHFNDMSFVCTPFANFIAGISMMDAMFTVDSAGMHVAGCLGIPCLSIFGLTSGKHRASYYPTVKYIDAKADCAPCWNIMQRIPCENDHCLAFDSLDPDEIAMQILEVCRYGEKNCVG